MAEDEKHWSDSIEVAEDDQGAFFLYDEETEEDFASFDTEDEAQAFLDWLVDGDINPRGLSEEEIQKLVDTFDATYKDGEEEEDEGEDESDEPDDEGGGEPEGGEGGEGNG